MLTQDQVQPQALFPSIGTAQRFQPKPETAPAESTLATLYAPPEADHAPQQSDAIPPETLKKFRRGYGEEAEQVATQLKGIVVTSAAGVLRQAKLLSKLKERLNRKEWVIWLKEVLGWFGKEVAPYLQIAKVFGKFDPAVFRELEPFTLLKIRTKRYAPLVERLREELVVTSKLIQNLICEVIPTPSKRKKAAPNYDEAVLKQRLNGEDGTFYFTLHANLGDKQGSWLEEKLENRTLGQVLEHAKSLEKQAEERRDDMKEGIEAQIEQRVRNLVEMAEFSLKQEIADLRAQLQATTAKASVVGERAIANTNNLDDESSTSGSAQAASTTVGEDDEATSKAVDEQASTEALAQAASTTVGEYDEATLKTDDQASTEVLAVPVSTSVVERAIATTDALDDEASAGVILEPTDTILAAVPEAPEPTDDSPGTTAQSPGNQSAALLEPASATADEKAAQYPVEATSLTEADTDARAAQSQEITPPWKQLSQLREAEKYIQEVDGHIKKFNSDLNMPRLDKLVSNQIRDALSNRQKLRSTKIGQVMAVADASGIIADYEALRNSGRVVLAPSYASALLRQAESWSEVAMVVGNERDQLLRAVKEWGVEEKQLLVQLLSSHLETESNPLEQIDWIPKNLLSRALSNFTFRLQRIKDSDNLVDEVEMEYLEGCNFVSVQNLGDRQEQWVFEFKSKNIPVFGREQIVIEKF